MAFTPENIHHYRIIRELGKGGMGEVYLAEDTRLDRKVALKILPSEFASDVGRMARFIQEAKTASALNHPGIITIYEIGDADGLRFILRSTEQMACCSITTANAAQPTQSPKNSDSVSGRLSVWLFESHSRSLLGCQ